MGFLFLIIIGILAMVFIARFASKTRPKGEEVKSPYRGGYGDVYSSKSQKVDSVLQKGLVSLLLKKNIIREEELLEELEKIKKEEN